MPHDAHSANPPVWAQAKKSWTASAPTNPSPPRCICGLRPVHSSRGWASARYSHSFTNPPSPWRWRVCRGVTGRRRLRLPRVDPRRSGSLVSLAVAVFNRLLRKPKVREARSRLNGMSRVTEQRRRVRIHKGDRAVRRQPTFVPVDRTRLRQTKPQPWRGNRRRHETQHPARGVHGRPLPAGGNLVRSGNRRTKVDCAPVEACRALHSRGRRKGCACCLTAAERLITCG